MVATAPGKLVLMGEYAVLRGHSAVVAAVDVRARCSWAPGPFAVTRDEGGLIDACIAAWPHREEGRFVVDTTAFSSNSGKYGLGSSAAACVAFLRASHPDLDRHQLHEVAQLAHRNFQKGRGSGVDVCASVYGGFQRFAREHDGYRVSPLRGLPDGVVLLPVWTGIAADTREFLRKVESLVEFDACCDILGDASRRFEQARVPGDVFAAVDAARVGLAALGAAADADIVSLPHQKLARIAAMYGGAAKPSGAGGGDVCLVFVVDEVVAGIAEAIGRAGFRILPFALGAPGVDLASDVVRPAS